MNATYEYLLIGSYHKFKWENTHTLTHSHRSNVMTDLLVATK